MKTAMKKLFSLVLVAVLLIGVMPFQASADGTSTKYYIKLSDTDIVEEGDLTPGEKSDPGTLIPPGYEFEWAQQNFGNGANPGYIYPGTSYEVGIGDSFWIFVKEAPHEHNYTSEITTESTCTEAGVKTFTCSCGEGTYTEAVDAKGHQPGADATCTTAQVCTRDGCGEELEKAKGHDYENGKCIRCSICEVCSNVNCTCPAKVLIRAKKSSDAGYPDGGSFNVSAGSRSVIEIYKKADYSDDIVDSYCVTDKDGGNKRYPGENIDLTAGGEYILWIELKETPQSVPSTPLEPANPTKQHTLTLNANGGKVSPETIKVNHGGMVENLPVPTRRGYEFLGWYTRANGGDVVKVITNMTENRTVYARWSEKKSDDNDTEKFDVSVNLNYDHKKGDTVKNVAKNTTMAEVLKRVDTPTRWGYKFDGWYWDANCKNDVERDDKVRKDCEIFAKWERKSSEVMLKIYVNGDTKSPAKIVDLYDHSHDTKISMWEVQDIVKRYYTAKDSDGLTFYGLFDFDGWSSFVRNRHHKGVKDITVNADDDTVVYVMVHNAKVYASSSSGTADSSNPKTGDMIMTPVIVLCASVGALATLYYLNKKRAI